MTISIITPSFNQAEFLCQQISSVKSQNEADQEHIIIDGGSADGSVDIIRKYEKHLAYWVSEPDNGQSHAINKGIRKAGGDIINWLNADDYYEPNALSAVADAFSDESVNVVMGKSAIVKNNQTIRQSRGTDVYPDNLPKTIGWARIDQPETFFRKSAWDKVGLLNERLHYTMDREWWMRYLYCFGLKGIKRIENVLVNFRIHDESKTSLHAHKFQREHDTLFYLMTQAAQTPEIAKVIEENCHVDFSIDSQIAKWDDVALCRQSLNYYLLKKADELYYQDRSDLAKEFLRKINPEWLSEEDRRLFQTLKVKVRLPLSIVHFLRKK